MANLTPGPHFSHAKAPKQREDTTLSAQCEKDAIVAFAVSGLCERPIAVSG
jgi:hypothetical protein